jgi:hypothetical protein
VVLTCSIVESASAIYHLTPVVTSNEVVVTPCGSLIPLEITRGVDSEPS